MISSNWKSGGDSGEHFCKEIVIFKLIYDRPFEIEKSDDKSLETRETRLKILARLAEEGIFENISQLIVTAKKLFSPRFFQIACSMINLKKIEIWDPNVQFTDLAHFFGSCPKLIELKLVNMNVKFPYGEFEIDEDLKHQLKLGFKRLGRVELRCNVQYNSWRIFLQILT